MSDSNPALTHPSLRPGIDRGVADLADRYPVSEAVVRTVIARVAWESYQRGRADAIGELLTTEQVATMLGLPDRIVRKRAEVRGLGWKMSERAWLFTPADVAAMRVPGKAGRPRKIA